MKIENYVNNLLVSYYTYLKRILYFHVKVTQYSIHVLYTYEGLSLCSMEDVNIYYIVTSLVKETLKSTRKHGGELLKING